MTIIRNMLLLLVSGLLLQSAARAESITVSAAISLKEALTAIADEYEKSTGHEVEMNFGASGQLATQIENGAPIDLFISAAQAQIDQLAAAKRIDPKVVRSIAGNELVLIVPADAPGVPVHLKDLADNKYARIAIGNPRFVPAGQYAMQALRAARLDAVEPKLVAAASVRQVLDYVERGDASAGFVYRTDARQAKEKVKTAIAVDPSTHDAITYPAAVIVGSKKAAFAEDFLQFLLGRDAQRILRDKGFSPVDAPSTRPVTP